MGRVVDEGASAFGLGLPGAMPRDPNAVITHDIITDVLTERVRQVARWGDRSHADGTGTKRDIDLARIKRAVTQAQARDGDPTWRAIAEEELYKALAESDLERLDAELVQTAAVLVAWLLDVRRRRRELMENAGKAAT